MATADTEKIIMEEKRESSMNMIAIAVIVACVVAVAALIVAVVGISKQSSIVVNPSGSSAGNGGGSSITIMNPSYSGGSGGVVANGDRIWRFHIGHFGGNTQYLDEASGQVRGYDVDVVNAVCQIAGKNCIIAWDIYENCWDSEAGQRARGGVGLMGNWYDACIGWLQTRDRRRTYEFSNQIGLAYPVSLFVKTGGTIAGYPNLSGVKIGILDGWYADEHCLVRYENIMNFDQTNENLIFHYRTEDDIAAALNSNEIDAAFVARTPNFLAHSDVETFMVGDFAVNECVTGGVSIMLPKANVDVLSWFNPAFDRLLGSRDYDEICQDLTIAHGDMPGYAPEDYCIQ